MTDHTWPCTSCGGEGTYPNGSPCPICGGSGVLSHELFRRAEAERLRRESADNQSAVVDEPVTMRDLAYRYAISVDDLRDKANRLSEGRAPAGARTTEELDGDSSLCRTLSLYRTIADEREKFALHLVRILKLQEKVARETMLDIERALYGAHVNRMEELEAGAAEEQDHWSKPTEFPSVDRLRRALAIRHGIVCESLDDMIAASAGLLESTTSTVVLAQPCDECDPAFGCFLAPSQCVKKPMKPKG